MTSQSRSNGYIVSVGNAFDGLSFIGPFDDGEEANEYADRYLTGLEWFVIRLEEREYD